jgi:hypothetical protein
LIGKICPEEQGKPLVPSVTSLSTLHFSLRHSAFCF